MKRAFQINRDILKNNKITKSLKTAIKKEENNKGIYQSTYLQKRFTKNETNNLSPNSEALSDASEEPRTKTALGAFAERELTKQRNEAKR